MYQGRQNAIQDWESVGLIPDKHNGIKIWQISSFELVPIRCIHWCMHPCSLNGRYIPAALLIPVRISTTFPAPCLGYKATCSSDINAQSLNKIAFLISEGLRWRSYRRSVDGQSNLYQAWEWQSIILKKKTTQFKKCSKGWPQPKNIGTLKTDRSLKGDRLTGCHLIQVQS